MVSNRLRLPAFASLICVLSACASASDNLKVTLEPAIDGGAGQGICPVIADIENRGSATKGVLRVDSGGSLTDYPVQLPGGAKKRVITYPYNSFGLVRFRLETDEGSVDEDLQLGVQRADGEPVLLISDHPGELSFLTSLRSPRSDESQPTGALIDCYTRPESAPPRPLGYQSVSEIILGAGAERLSDEQIEAIRLRVLTGGTVVFIGGTSSPVLTDHRWASLLPATGFRPAHLAEALPQPPQDVPIQGETLADLGQSPSPAAEVLSAIPVEGASSKRSGSTLLWAEKPSGLGLAVYLSFNPFEPPFKSWSGRGKALSVFLRPTTSVVAGQFIGSYSGDDSSFGGGAGVLGGIAPTAPYDTTPPAGAPPGMKPRPFGGGGGPVDAPEDVLGEPDHNDPFSMQLPPAEQIFWILAAYFVVVIPANFLVLKKLKRGELAWFTAPLVSLAFAAILFTSAGFLYKAKMTTITTGMLVGQDGEPEGMFIGKSQLFIPHAGSYDLGLHDVDFIETRTSPAFVEGGTYVGGADRPTNIEPVDVGMMTIPNLQSDNLSFQQLSYRQRVPVGQLVRVRLQRTGPFSARCEITDSGDCSVVNAMIVAGSHVTPIGDLVPGLRKLVDVDLSPGSAPTSDQSEGALQTLTRNGDRVALTGTLRNYRPGPQLGALMQSRSEVSMTVFSSWTGGQP